MAVQVVIFYRKVGTYQISPNGLLHQLAQSFVLPKSILYKINAMNNKFLWERATLDRELHMASMEKVCKKKELRGLGIIDVEIWNKGAYCGLIWKALTSEKSLWASWVREYSLKNKYFWTIDEVKDCSSSIWGLLKHRKVARKLIW